MNATAIAIVEAAPIPASPPPPQPIMLVETTADQAQAQMLTQEENKVIGQLGSIIVSIAEQHTKNTGRSPFEHPSVSLAASAHSLGLLNIILGYAHMKADASNRDRNNQIVDLAKESAKSMLLAKGYKPGEEDSAVVVTQPMKGGRRTTITAVYPPPTTSEIAPAASTASVIERKPAPAFKNPSSIFKIKQDRTKLIPLPEYLYSETDVVTETRSRGHQVDPGRTEGYAPVMPNIDLLAATGNPYPADVNDKTVVTGDKYRPMVRVSRAVWNALQAAGEIEAKPTGPVLDAILGEAVVALSNDARSCIADTLRDLALFGLCSQHLLGTKRIFTKERP